jgi:hypothetical protein
MSSTWDQPACEAPPTGCSCHDPATSGSRRGRSRRGARQQGLARYLGPATTTCLATPRNLGPLQVASVVVSPAIQNCAKASPSSREIALSSSRVLSDLGEAHPVMKEIVCEPPRMARLVGLGVGTQPPPAQADDRSALHRDRPSTDAERASGYREDVVEGRWVIETRHRGRPWEGIVEPDRERQLLVVVTAYPVWE